MLSNYFLYHINPFWYFCHVDSLILNILINATIVEKTYRKCKGTKYWIKTFHFIDRKTVLHTFSFQFYKNKLVFILSNVNDKWYTYACTCFQLNSVREILDKWDCFYLPTIHKAPLFNASIHKSLAIVFVNKNIAYKTPQPMHPRVTILTIKNLC